MGTNTKNFCKLSIVIPVFNERETLLMLIKQVQSVNISLEKEIILVDDCSTDGTRELLKSELLDNKLVKVYHTVNLGKGAELRSGFGAERQGNKHHA